MIGTTLVLFLFLFLLAWVCVGVYLAVIRQRSRSGPVSDWRRAVHWSCLLLFSAIASIVVISVYALDMRSFFLGLLLHWGDILTGLVVIALLILAIELLAPTRLRSRLASAWRSRRTEEESGEAALPHAREDIRLDERRNESDFGLAMRAICYILLLFGALCVGGALLLEAVSLPGTEKVLPVLRQVSACLLFLALPVSLRQTVHEFRMLRENRTGRDKKEEGRILELMNRDNGSL